MLEENIEQVFEADLKLFFRLAFENKVSYLTEELVLLIHYLFKGWV